MKTQGKPLHLDKQTLEWLKKIAGLITYRGRPLSQSQRMDFLVRGRLPKGAEYPKATDPSAWGMPEIQALLFAGFGRDKGVASGPYAVATGTENFFARQIKPKP